VNDDVKSVLGWWILCRWLGTGLVLLGTFYLLNEWRMGGAVLFMGLVWGLSVCGTWVGVHVDGARLDVCARRCRRCELSAVRLPGREGAPSAVRIFWPRLGS
jgi:hypothetical protein